jgi:hypothetical protein
MSKQSKIMNFISRKARARKEKWDKIWGFAAILLWLTFMAGMVILLLWNQEFFVSFRDSNFLGRTISKLFKKEDVIPRYRIFFILITFIYPVCASIGKGMVDDNKFLIFVGAVIAIGVSVVVTIDFVGVVKTYYNGNVGDYFNAVLQLNVLKEDGFKSSFNAFLAMEGMPEAVKMNFYSFCSCATFLLSIPAVISYQKEYNKRVKLFGKKLRISTLYISMALGALLSVIFSNAIGLGVSTTGVATKFVNMLRDTLKSKKYERQSKGMNLEELEEDYED